MAYNLTMNAATIDAAIEALVDGSPLSVTVRGDCMDPAIADGDIAHVQPKPRYWPGDIVLIRRHDGELVLHRYLGRYYRQGEWRVVTRADNGREADTAVPWSRLVGALCATGRSGAHWRPGLAVRLRSFSHYVRHVTSRFLHHLR